MLDKRLFFIYNEKRKKSSEGRHAAVLLRAGLRIYPYEGDEASITELHFGEKGFDIAIRKEKGLFFMRQPERKQNEKTVL